MPRLALDGGWTRSDDPALLFSQKLQQGRFTTDDFALSELNDPSPSNAWNGGVVVEQDGRIRAFVPRGSGEPTWHFVGVQIAEREAFASLADGVPAESVAGVYRTLIASRPGAVRAFRSNATFFDIGTPRDYLDACLRLSGSGIVVDRTARVSPTARVTRSVIFEGAEVGAGANLDSVVVLGGARVPEGVVASNAVVTSGPDGVVVTPFE